MEKAEKTGDPSRKKWTKELVDAGYTVFPSVILERQKALGLDPVDVNILLHLARHWWFHENLPHPSKRAIAECMQKSESTVRRRIARMEKDGLLQRKSRFNSEGGQTSNSYSLQGLIEAATPFAREVIQEKNRQKTESQTRRNRKKPIVKTNEKE